MYRLFDILHNGTIPRRVLNQLTDLLGTDLITENERQQLQGLYLDALIDSPKRPVALLDEVDTARGDAINRYVQEFLIPNCITHGMTATHTFRDGKTVGDHIFGGIIPAYEDPLQQSVNDKEIVPIRNLVFEADVPQENRGEIAQLVRNAEERARAQGATDRDLDYSAGEQEKMARLSGIDNLAVKILLKGSDPDNHKRYLDMKQIWFCANVGHAQTVAQKVNGAIAKHIQDHPEDRERLQSTEPYAQVVHGKMGDEDIAKVILNFREGKTRAVTNNRYLVRGFDDNEAELGFQLCPSRSPNVVLQQGGRFTRKNPKDKYKIANIISFAIPEVEQVLFGPLAGGMRILPNDFEFPPTEGAQNRPGEPRWRLDIGAKSVITTEEEYTIFRERQGRRSQKKPDTMLTFEEMARKFNPQAKGERFQREVDRLRQRLYEPLSSAYQIRQARQAYVGLQDAQEPEEGNDLAVRGQPFPVWRIGNYKHEGKQKFCIDEGISHLARFALIGAVKERPPEFMTKSQARSAVTGNSASNAMFDELMAHVIEAFLDRPPYTQNINAVELALQFERSATQLKKQIEGTDGQKTVLGERLEIIQKLQEQTRQWGGNLSIRAIGFFRRANSKDAFDFCVSSEALKPLFQITRNAEPKQAELWWKQNYENHKTREWLDLSDVKRELGISLTSMENAVLDQQWNRIAKKAKDTCSKINPWEDHAISLPITGARHDAELRCANRRTPNDATPKLCVYEASLSTIERLIGRVGEVEADERMPRGRRR